MMWWMPMHAVHRFIMILTLNHPSHPGLHMHPLWHSQLDDLLVCCCWSQPRVDSSAQPKSLFTWYLLLVGTLPPSWYPCSNAGTRDTPVSALLHCWLLKFYCCWPLSMDAGSLTPASTLVSSLVPCSLAVLLLHTGLCHRGLDCAFG